MLARLIAFLTALTIAVAPADALVGPRRALLFARHGSVPYQGPIDINGAAYALWSTRCGSNAYVGNVLDVWDSATGSTTETLITCSAGGVLNQTIHPLATTCASGCVAKTIYDQSGSNNCSSAPCNLTQATLAKMPALTTNCQNGLICLALTSASTQCWANSTNTAISQPYSFSWVANRITVANETLFGGTSGTAFQPVNYQNAANTVSIFIGGSTPVATANDNALHAIQFLVNAASTAWSIDGVGTTASVSPGSGGVGSTGFSIGSGSTTGCNINPFNGKFFELGLWGSSVTANNAAMNSNQHSYWNF